jgi:hypothetical protein
MKHFPKILLNFFLSLVVLLACRQRNAAPSKELIDQINLKRGAVISRYRTVAFL